MRVCEFGEKTIVLLYPERKNLTQLHLNWNGHRPIIDQMDLHVSGKLAGLHNGVGLAGLGYEVVVKALAICGRCGAGKAGAIAAAYIGGQSELTHHQQSTLQTLAIQILQRAIHLAVFVAENAQLQKLAQHLVSIGHRIALFCTQEQQQTLLYLSNHLAIYYHSCFKHTLRYTNHSKSLSESK
jgi:hypothetical protein